MKRKAGPFFENIAEATTACLIAMVQGNVLALGISHWVIASQTGVAGGVLASAAILITRTTKPWMISMFLGIATTVADYFVHPGMIGGVATEAILTGIGAAILSYIVQSLLRRVRKGRSATETKSVS